ncbi:hypothetical protein [Nonomuraea sp. NPDC050202]|uniref:hypothetical protein n=1 Tax=Nonomuraea sp. NPDC050202 TaxID=3155035 RepID=UPI0033E77D32
MIEMAHLSQPTTMTIDGEQYHFTPVSTWPGDGFIVSYADTDLVLTVTDQVWKPDEDVAGEECTWTQMDDAIARIHELNNA